MKEKSREAPNFKTAAERRSPDRLEDIFYRRADQEIGAPTLRLTDFGDRRFSIVAVNLAQAQ